MADTRLAKIGLTPKEPWAAGISYEVLDVTLYSTQNGGDGCSYVAMRNNIGVTPGTDDTVWLKLSQAGQSIYDLAVKYGHFVGTEEEFEEQYQQVLQAARDAASATNATNVEVQAAENARVTAEAGRVEAETQRASAESSRRSAESARVTAEAGRATAETGRVGAESDRVSAESARVSAESGRESAEASRQSAETTRAATFGALEQDMRNAINTIDATNTRVTEDEAARVSAESARVSAENSRATAETGRANAENARVNAESGRVSAEVSRVNAEGQRVSAENARASAETGRASAETARVNAESSRSSAETGRVNAEAGRVSAETARETQASADHTRAEADHASIADKANVDGYYSGMTVGLAENLVGRNDVTGEFFERTSGGDAEISNGVAQLNRVGGKSQVWNQLVDTITTEVTLINGRKYLTRISGTAGIVTGTGQTVSGLGSTDNVFDLTLIFGSGNEPSTVEEFEAWLESNIGLREYYPYNAGTVLNVNMTGIETLGFNLLDPATGKARIIGAYSDVYGNYYGITGTHGAITFTSDLGETSTITPDSDGKFLLEEPGELTVADAGADCSVFLWWDGAKTEHEDYERTVTNLDVAHIYGKLNGTGDLVKVWPTGIPGIGDVKDSLKVVDGAVVAERKVGEVDMGSLSWVASQSYSNKFYAFLTSASAENHGKNIINGKYRAVYDSLSGLKNGQMRIFESSPSNSLYVCDTAYSDAATFKTAVTGQMLYYELATPQTYTDLVYQGSALFADGTPVTMPTNYPVNNWSVERIVPQNSSEAVVTTAPELTCRYSIDAVETLNTHADEIENLYDELEELDAKKANKVGDYPGLSVGTARNLSAENAVPAEYVFRKTPDGAATGIATVQRLKGKSLVWNQLFNHKAEGQYTVDGCTFTQNLGRIVAVLTEDKDEVTNYAFALGSISFIKGHKYYINGYIGGTTSASGTARVWVQSSVAFPAGHRLYSYNGGMILDALENEVLANNYYSCQLTPHTPTGTYVFNPILFDLTLMFGAGNEPSTVSEFEAMYPLPYYEYNPGEIINNEAEAIETVGFNQWDEEREAGGISSSNGQNTTTDGYYRSKNFIPAFPNTQYYFKTPVSMGVLQYDANKEYIKGIYTTTTGIFTTHARCRYLRFRNANANQWDTYNHDICINLSDPARNGQYEPYEKHTLQLGLDAFDVKDSEDNVITVNGLKSAGSVYDEIDLARGKYIKRIGSVDLGTLNWELRSGTADVFQIANPVSYETGNPGLICSKYPCIIVTSGASVVDGPDKTLSCYAVNNTVRQFYVKDSAYSEAATFKTAMSGVMLYYELAEPVEYDLVNPIQTNYNVINGGTERRLPEDTASSVLAPIAYDVVYALDAVGILTGLPQNYVSKESLQAMLTAMQSAGIFSAYTMTWDATNQRYTFTFTNNS